MSRTTCEWSLTAGPPPYLGGICFYRDISGRDLEVGSIEGSGHHCPPPKVNLVPSRACANSANTVWWHWSNFLGPEIQSSGWPIKIEELHNHMNEIEVEGEADSFVMNSHLVCLRGLFLGLVFWLKPKNRDSIVWQKWNPILYSKEIWKDHLECIAFYFIPSQFWMVYEWYTNARFWLASQYFGWIELPGPRNSANVTIQCLRY